MFLYGNRMKLMCMFGVRIICVTLVWRDCRGSPLVARDDLKRIVFLPPYSSANHKPQLVQRKRRRGCCVIVTLIVVGVVLVCAGIVLGVIASKCQSRAITIPHVCPHNKST